LPGTHYKFRVNFWTCRFESKADIAQSLRHVRSPAKRILASLSRPSVGTANTVTGVSASNQPWRLKMTRIIFAAVALAFLMVCLQPAAADYDEAPWCAVVGMGKGVYWDCQYRSFEACQPNVLAGNRGWCNPNPYFVSNAPISHQYYRKHHARAQRAIPVR